jgi:hypothetical protein
LGVYLGRKAGEEQLPAPLLLPAPSACNELGGLQSGAAAGRWQKSGSRLSRRSWRPSERPENRLRGSRRSREGREPRPATVESQETAHRPWWRRMFGR